MSSFATVLSALQRRSRRSQRSVALAAELDPGRYSRLLSGERQPASREQVLALAAALALDRRDTDHLVAAAGYLPPSLEQIGVDDPAVLAVLAVLTDPGLSEPARQAFRQTVVAIASHWHEGGRRDGAAGAPAGEAAARRAAP
jgi:hypothetical protein